MDPRAGRGVGEQPAARPQLSLLSARCTTGWLDWMHGELWLLPDGLLRVCDGTGRRSREDEEPAPPAAEELEQLRGHARSVWVRADEIVRASVRSGILTSRLTLLLADGGRRKLLWPSSDRAAVVLREAFATWEVPGA
jgi:hypothetical protein